jgi:ribosomal protein S18 acetylase RimI-like enzyme
VISERFILRKILMVIIELEGFAVHPNWQRKGVGSMLVKKFLESVDADYAKCYVHASRVGKSLYENFGFNMMGAVTVDMREFGDYEPYTTWDMQREAV